MRLLLDNDVPVILARVLNERGHDAVTARDLGSERHQDYEQLVVATQDDRMLVTHNGRDFRLLDGAWRTWTRIWAVDRRHSGIVLLPQSTNVQWLADLMENLAESGTSTTQTMFQLREGRIWEAYSLESRLR